MATTIETKKRRAFQGLWSSLDRHLLPFVPDGVVLAISGGPDSRALLEAIANWPARIGAKIIVAAIDHGARSASAHEVRFVTMRAQRLGFDAYAETLITTDSTSGEQDLRIERYHALRRIAALSNCKSICTAHHRDDNAEGYLMALMGVGGGEMGASMTEVTSVDGVFLIRPFLELTKEELMLPLSLSGLTDFAKDALDEARVGERAYVRHEILPHLGKITKNVKSRLHTFGQAQRLQRSSLDNLANSLIIWHEDRAELSLDPMPEHSLIIVALWLILKKFSDGRDLRASRHTIDRIAKDLILIKNTKKQTAAGLDPTLNGFNLRNLSVKQYQFPGVLVLKSPKEIVVRRIDSVSH